MTTGLMFLTFFGCRDNRIDVFDLLLIGAVETIDKRQDFSRCFFAAKFDKCIGKRQRLCYNCCKVVILCSVSLKNSATAEKQQSCH